MSSAPPPYSPYPQPQGPPPAGFDPKYTAPYPQQPTNTTIYVQQPPQQVIYQQGYPRTQGTTVYVVDNSQGQRMQAQRERQEAEDCACMACCMTLLCCCLLNN